MMVIVPNTLRDSINRVLDAALAECPGAALDRELFFDELLNYFNEYGVVPEFSFAKRDDKETT